MVTVLMQEPGYSNTMVPCTLTVRRLLPPSTAGGATEALIALPDLARVIISGGGLPPPESTEMSSIA